MHYLDWLKKMTPEMPVDGLKDDFIPRTSFLCFNDDFMPRTSRFGVIRDFFTHGLRVEFRVYC